MSTPLLQVHDLHAWYGESHILHGVDFEIHEGELVTLLGRNGAGRSTTVKSLLGLTGSRKGSVRIAGVETIGLQTHEIARLAWATAQKSAAFFRRSVARRTCCCPPSWARGGSRWMKFTRCSPT